MPLVIQVIDRRMSLILVTGAAGFIGARYVEFCNQNGSKLISVDSPEYFRDRAEHRGLDFGQIIDRDHLFSWLEENQPALSGVVHLGACTDTTELDEEYLRQVNLEYSQKIWNYCVDHSVPLVYASSAATYGAGENGYDDSEDRIPALRPLNPYGESKRLFDLWVLEQERLGRTPPSWCGFKFFNVYGFGERHKGKMCSVVIQAFDQIRESGIVRLFKSYKKEFADGEQQRDFIYVDDVVNALNFALTHPIRRGIYNLGTGQARSFKDLARATFQALGIPEKTEFIEMPKDLRARYQYFTEATTERLRAAGYSRPFTSLENGVRAYVNRLKSF